MRILLTISAVIVFSSYNTKTEFNIDDEFAGITEIEISTISGDCMIIKSGDQKVKVFLSYDYKPDKTYEPVISQIDNVLAIKENIFKSNSGQSNWIISVPENIKINFNSSSGDMTLIEVSGDIKINTSSGDIDAKRLKISNESEFNSSSGNVNLQDIQGKIKINTSSGNLYLNGGKSDIKFNTSSGDITLENISGSIHSNTSSGDIIASGIALSNKSQFVSSSGDVIVTLQESPKFDVKIASSSGLAKLDFNGIKINGHIEMQSRVGKGEINCPYEFDTEVEKTHSSQKYWVKSLKIGSGNPSIKIHTASGEAVLIK